MHLSRRGGKLYRELWDAATRTHAPWVLVTSFNEWYEDTQIEATSGTVAPSHTDDSTSKTYYTGGQRYVDYEYLYLDILREMLK